MSESTPALLPEAEWFARTHRPNYVIEAPGTEREWTRVKCDGDDCDFYVERHGWRNWREALNAHAAHLGAEIAARETAACADAWNQGFEQGTTYEDIRNPYLTALAATEVDQ